MPDLVFPLTRFREAGATDAELDQLIAEFERSDVAVQGSMAGYYTGISEGDIREYLDRLREADHFATEHEVAESSETDTEVETEPLVPVADPVSASGTPAYAGNLQVPPPIVESAPPAS